MDFAFLDLEKGINFNFFFKRKKIFIIHGHDQDNVEKLQNMLYSFNLEPIVLGQHYSFEAPTIIEKFEKIGARCKYAIALCTPDDLINKDDKIYSQPRPNVLYEIGWFCARLGRKRVLIFVKDGTDIFSDFQGVIQVRFKGNVKECYESLHKALRNQNIA
ncbi:MAG TPA: nucleotide-binding protein [Chitinophagaceae bacterium]|jgi:predicted nucleotide-binding protein|nr:nucleotide-binding protein [Chitinophagaceae bacterium]